MTEDKSTEVISAPAPTEIQSPVFNEALKPEADELTPAEEASPISMVTPAKLEALTEEKPTEVISAPEPKQIQSPVADEVIKPEAEEPSPEQVLSPISEVTPSVPEVLTEGKPTEVISAPEPKEIQSPVSDEVLESEAEEPSPEEVLSPLSEATPSVTAVLTEGKPTEVISAPEPKEIQSAVSKDVSKPEAGELTPGEEALPIIEVTSGEPEALTEKKPTEVISAPDPKEIQSPVSDEVLEPQAEELSPEQVPSPLSEVTPSEPEVLIKDKPTQGIAIPEPKEIESPVSEDISKTKDEEPSPEENMSQLSEVTPGEPEALTQDKLTEVISAPEPEEIQFLVSDEVLEPEAEELSPEQVPSPKSEVTPIEPEVLTEDKPTEVISAPEPEEIESPVSAEDVSKPEADKLTPAEGPSPLSEVTPSEPEDLSEDKPTEVISAPEPKQIQSSVSDELLEPEAEERSPEQVLSPLSQVTPSVPEALTEDKPTEVISAPAPKWIQSVVSEDVLKQLADELTPGEEASPITEVTPGEPEALTEEKPTEVISAPDPKEIQSPVSDEVLEPEAEEPSPEEDTFQLSEVTPGEHEALTEDKPTEVISAPEPKEIQSLVSEEVLEPEAEELSPEQVPSPISEVTPIKPEVLTEDKPTEVISAPEPEEIESPVSAEVVSKPEADELTPAKVLSPLTEVTPSEPEALTEDKPTEVISAPEPKEIQSPISEDISETEAHEPPPEEDMSQLSEVTPGEPEALTEDNRTEVISTPDPKEIQSPVSDEVLEPEAEEPSPEQVPSPLSEFTHSEPEVLIEDKQTQVIAIPEPKEIETPISEDVSKTEAEEPSPEEDTFQLSEVTPGEHDALTEDKPTEVISAPEPKEIPSLVSDEVLEPEAEEPSPEQVPSPLSEFTHSEPEEAKEPSPEEDTFQLSEVTPGEHEALTEDKPTEVISAPEPEEIESPVSAEDVSKPEADELTPAKVLSPLSEVTRSEPEALTEDKPTEVISAPEPKEIKSPISEDISETEAHEPSPEEDMSQLSEVTPGEPEALTEENRTEVISAPDPKEIQSPVSDVVLEPEAEEPSPEQVPSPLSVFTHSEPEVLIEDKQKQVIAIPEPKEIETPISEDVSKTEAEEPSPEEDTFQLSEVTPGEHDALTEDKPTEVISAPEPKEIQSLVSDEVLEPEAEEPSPEQVPSPLSEFTHSEPEEAKEPSPEEDTFQLSEVTPGEHDALTEDKPTEVISAPEPKDIQSLVSDEVLEPEAEEPSPEKVPSPISEVTPIEPEVLTEDKPTEFISAPEPEEIESPVSAEDVSKPEADELTPAEVPSPLSEVTPSKHEALTEDKPTEVISAPEPKQIQSPVADEVLEPGAEEPSPDEVLSPLSEGTPSVPEDLTEGKPAEVILAPEPKEIQSPVSDEVLKPEAEEPSPEQVPSPISEVTPSEPEVLIEDKPTQVIVIIPEPKVIESPISEEISETEAHGPSPEEDKSQLSEVTPGEPEALTEDKPTEVISAPEPTRIQSPMSNEVLEPEAEEPSPEEVLSPLSEGTPSIPEVLTEDKPTEVISAPEPKEIQSLLSDEILQSEVEEPSFEQVPSPISEVTPGEPKALTEDKPTEVISAPEPKEIQSAVSEDVSKPEADELTPGEEASPIIKVIPGEPEALTEEKPTDFLSAPDPKEIQSPISEDLSITEADALTPAEIPSPLSKVTPREPEALSEDEPTEVLSAPELKQIQSPFSDEVLEPEAEEPSPEHVSSPISEVTPSELEVLTEDKPIAVVSAPEPEEIESRVSAEDVSKQEADELTPAKVLSPLSEVTPSEPEALTEDEPSEVISAPEPKQIQSLVSDEELKPEADELTPGEEESPIIEITPGEPEPLTEDKPTEIISAPEPKEIQSPVSDKVLKPEVTPGEHDALTEDKPTEVISAPEPKDIQSLVSDEVLEPEAEEPSPEKVPSPISEVTPIEPEVLTEEKPTEVISAPEPEEIESPVSAEDVSKPEADVLTPAEVPFPLSEVTPSEHEVLTEYKPTEVISAPEPKQIQSPVADEVLEPGAEEPSPDEVISPLSEGTPSVPEDLTEGKPAEVILAPEPKEIQYPVSDEVLKPEAEEPSPEHVPSPISEVTPSEPEVLIEDKPTPGIAIPEPEEIESPVSEDISKTKAEEPSPEKNMSQISEVTPGEPEALTQDKLTEVISAPEPKKIQSLVSDEVLEPVAEELSPEQVPSPISEVTPIEPEVLTEDKPTEVISAPEPKEIQTPVSDEVLDPEAEEPSPEQVPSPLSEVTPSEAKVLTEDKPTQVISAPEPKKIESPVSAEDVSKQEVDELTPAEEASPISVVTPVEPGPLTEDKPTEVISAPEPKEIQSAVSEDVSKQEADELTPVKVLSPFSEVTPSEPKVIESPVSEDIPKTEVEEPSPQLSEVTLGEPEALTKDKPTEVIIAPEPKDYQSPVLDEVLESQAEDPSPEEVLSPLPEITPCKPEVLTEDKHAEVIIAPEPKEIQSPVSDEVLKHEAEEPSPEQVPSPISEVTPVEPEALTEKKPTEVILAPESKEIQSPVSDEVLIPEVEEPPPEQVISSLSEVTPSEPESFTDDKPTEVISPHQPKKIQSPVSEDVTKPPPDTKPTDRDKLIYDTDSLEIPAVDHTEEVIIAKNDTLKCVTTVELAVEVNDVQEQPKHVAGVNIMLVSTEPKDHDSTKSHFRSSFYRNVEEFDEIHICVPYPEHYATEISLIPFINVMSEIPQRHISELVLTQTDADAPSVDHSEETRSISRTSIDLSVTSSVSPSSEKSSPIDSIPLQPSDSVTVMKSELHAPRLTVEKVVLSSCTSESDSTETESLIEPLRITHNIDHSERFVQTSRSTIYVPEKKRQTLTTYSNLLYEISPDQLPQTERSEAGLKVALEQITVHPGLQKVIGAERGESDIIVAGSGVLRTSLPKESLAHIVQCIQTSPQEHIKSDHSTRIHSSAHPKPTVQRSAQYSGEAGIFFSHHERDMELTEAYYSWGRELVIQEGSTYNTRDIVTDTEYTDVVECERSENVIVSEPKTGLIQIDETIMAESELERRKSLAFLVDKYNKSGEYSVNGQKSSDSQLDVNIEASSISVGESQTFPDHESCDKENDSKPAKEKSQKKKKKHVEQVAGSSSPAMHDDTGFDQDTIGAEEPEMEPEGRISADTSEQIFIEQTIQAARVSVTSLADDDRPPSPSQLTLVVDDNEILTSTDSHSELSDVFGYQDPGDLYTIPEHGILVHKTDASALDVDLIEEKSIPSKQRISFSPTEMPIDVTLESGLDQIGAEESGDDDHSDHDRWERSQSYEREEDPSSEVTFEYLRARHFSTPDYTLGCPGYKKLQATHPFVQDEEAVAGETETTHVKMKKKVHKKTVVRDDGCEETYIHEDTHISSDNEGPDELRDSIQEIIGNFMDTKGDFRQGQQSNDNNKTQ
ncbi:uncharacterized protein LOC141904097 isoform X4 [Tubulanus polymorphus]|uniref:uncharacterized protein LOC141904097 isoform X4 n=1 Tax=Tubulanus polymorphus TaxID=672921 RepID=UPI003DA36777